MQIQQTDLRERISMRDDTSADELRHASTDDNNSNVDTNSSSMTSKINSSADVDAAKRLLEQLDSSTTDALECTQSARCSEAFRFEVTLHKDVFGLGIYFAEATGCAIVDVELPFYRLPDDAIGPGEASGVIAPGDVLCAIDGRALQGLRLADVVEALRCIPIGAVTLTFERPMPRLVVVKSESQLADNQCESAAASFSEHDNVTTSSTATADNNQIEDENEHEDERKQRVQPSSMRWGVFRRLSSTAASLTGSGASIGSTSAALMEIAALQAAMRELETTLHDTEHELERERKCRFLAEKKNILYRNELVRRSDESATLRFELAREAAVRTQRESFVRDRLHVAI